jgi:sortase A
MIQSRRRSGVILLAIAAIITCLVLLSTTSSGAQARAEARAGGAVAVAGGNDCVKLNDNTSPDNTSPDNTSPENTSPDNTSPENTTNTTSSPNTSQDMGVTGTDTGNETSPDTVTGTGNITNQDPGTDTGDVTSQDTGTDTGEDNAISPDAQDNVGDTTSPDAQDNAGDTTSPDTQDNGNNECVIADTVPDESLPPTGAPVKSRANETTVEKKSDPGKKPEASSENQKKTDSSKKQESNSEQQKKSGSGKKLEIQERGKKIEVPDRSGSEPRQGKPESNSKAAPGSSKAAPSSSSKATSGSSEAAPKKDLAPVLATKWTRPSREEVASTDKPRHFAPNPGSEMTMSVRALGLYNAPVASSNQPEDLDNGLVREPKTSLPWDKGAQRNVYVAGHYLGYPDTPSRLVFYNLHKLEKNDEIILKNSLGQSYKYRVSEKFAAGPEDSWAMGQVKGRDMLTLQTCIPPDFGKRLIVRADRV